MARIIHRLFLEMEFPEGISPGDGKLGGNLLILARDGSERPVLRGTALAGAMRHAWAALHKHRADAPPVSAWFGAPLEGPASGLPSPLRLGDCVIEAGPDGAGSQVLRTHNAMNRHTGAVLGSGLFSLQAMPPGSRATACLWLDEEEGGEAGKARAFLAELAGIVSAGLVLGGHAARGIGRARLAAPALYREFRCADIKAHAALLDEERAWRCGQAPRDGEALAAAGAGDGRTLIVEVALAIPPGEDLLVGDGQGLDYEMEPQRVKCANGSERWRLPGSALRGVFRAWITRLAARGGKPVADSIEQYRNGKAMKGDKMAWGCDGQDVQKQHELEEHPDRIAELVKCPVMRLFGSSYARGRIHVSDALSEKPLDKKSEEQVRAHVAVDRITGGANEGFFFKNTVLVGSGRFTMRITLRDPGEEEAKWLAATLRAMHLGIVRVGCSKAGGRLRLAEKPRAGGPHAEIFNRFDMSEVVP